MAEKIPDRGEIPENHRWDLKPLFQTDELWHELRAALDRELDRYDHFRGRLAESASILKEAIDFDLSVSRSLEKLYTYAHLKSDEDTANQRYQEMHQLALNLYTRASERSSFFTPEIQAIPDETMDAFMASPGLREYAFYLQRILRYRPHTLSPEIEKILAMAGDMGNAAAEIFNQLDNADITFGFITDEQGRETELSRGNLATFLQSGTREIRKRAFLQNVKSYADHRNTIAASLLYSNKRDNFYARVRNFENCRRSSLFSDNVSDAVYDNLIDTVKKNLHPLFGYLRLRKRVLGLDELHYYDTHVPLVKDVPFNMPYEEAVATCGTALSILGAEYTETLVKGLSGGWVDRYENRGKRGGAYSSGCYDSPPYILTNYRDDNINSLYTLIHEAGHSMHSWYSNRAQPYMYHDYTIFVAEVASTFNETLLSHHLMERYRDDRRMKAYIINREIDNIRGTLYRQTMFAEFEQITHRCMDDNRPLTLEIMQNMYRGLLAAYFGDTMVIDEELTLEFLRIPHFYSSFYVYKYATGISAAIALARAVLAHGAPARDAYLRFLGLGGSLFPLDELREAGVDMASPEPVSRAIGHFGDLVDELTALLDGAGPDAAPGK